MDIITSGAARTMTSREIAELTGKRHDHVLRDVETMLRELGTGSPQNWGYLPDSLGRLQRVAELPKRECLILVSGYSVAMRARIIDRWQELEQATAPALPQTFAAALRALADQTELAEQQAAALALAAPKAEALDRLSGADGSLCLTEAAKVLKVAPRRLTAWLSEHAWIYKRAGARHWVAYQERIQQGVMEHRTTTLERPDGTDKVVDQVLVTGKGLARLAKLLGVAA